MKITILTTFPEMFTPLHTSMLGRAEKAGYSGYPRGGYPRLFQK